MTSHCRAATAPQLIRGYQGDYRRQSLTSVATREPPFDTSFHISLGDQGSAVRVRAPRLSVTPDYNEGVDPTQLLNWSLSPRAGRGTILLPR